MLTTTVPLGDRQVVGEDVDLRRPRLSPRPFDDGTAAEPPKRLMKLAWTRVVPSTTVTSTETLSSVATFLISIAPGATAGRPSSQHGMVNGWLTRATN